MNTPKVAIQNCYSYNQNEVFSCIQTICDESNFPSVQGLKVLVKPNILSDAKPEACITTNPEVVRAVIKYLKLKGASEIYVGDSPGIQNSNFHAANCGISDICQQENVFWCDFIEDPVVKQIKGTKFKVPLASIIDKVDIIISVCKFKTHTLMYTTGATKNLFGLIPSLNKAACHVKCPSRESFASFIVGLHETVKPDFCIMDGIIGMEGAGPANGKPRPTNLLMASNNCFAMDYAQAVIMGYQPLDIPILYKAKTKHLLPESIDYPLLRAQDLQIQDFDKIKIQKKTNLLSSLILPFLTRGLQKRKQRKEVAPKFDNEKCIKCLRCVNICPAKALNLVKDNEGQHIECNYNKCIRCYCCHEMCPVNAITVGEKND